VDTFNSRTSRSGKHVRYPR